MRLPIVDLPEPDWPTMEMILGTSPSSLKLIGCSACHLAISFADTPFNSRSGVPSSVVKPLGTAAAGSMKLSPPTSGTEEISSFV
jgi:hypothetical protein